MQLTTEDALEHVRALAEELGLRATPEVIADRSNLVVRLVPRDSRASIVARIAMATSLVRVGMAWLTREVDLARFLEGRGAHVTRPATVIDAGPFERHGYVISFWEEESLVDTPVDPRATGARLAHAHRALAHYPIERLPRWGGVEEAREVQSRVAARAVYTEGERRRLEEAWAKADRILESVPSRTASLQAVHGDAHIRNVLATTRGPVWTDWEDAFIGPVEWDIACLRSRLDLFGEERETIEAMTAAYDAPYDRALADELGLVRNLQVIPWLAVFSEREPEHLVRMRDRIARLV